MKKTLHRPQSFLEGAFVLSVSTVITKLMGACFKIPLTNAIGELGMGYFNTAYQLYLPVYTLATAGFPVAVSQMIAHSAAEGNWSRVRALEKLSRRLFRVTGWAGMLLLLLAASPYARSISGTESLWSIRMLVPALLFCCLSVSLRGYYNGLRMMTPTAVSQVIEASGKLFGGLCGARLILWSGEKEFQRQGTVFGMAAAGKAEAESRLLPLAAAGAVFGVTLGALCSWLYLLWYRCRHPGVPTGRKERTEPGLLRELLRISIPISLGALVLNIGNLLDTAFLQRSMATVSPEKLRALFETRIPDTLDARELVPYLYGCYTMAQSVSMLVPALSQSVAVSALPSVTKAYTQGDPAELEKSVCSVIRLSAGMAFPAGFGLLFLSEPILTLLFSGRPNGVQIAAPLLAVLGIASVGMALSVPINSVLQALGHSEIPVRLLLVGMILKLTVNYAFLPLPQYHLLGACLGTVLCYGVITVSGLLILQQWVPFSVSPLRCLAGPVLSGFLCGITARRVQQAFPISDGFPAAILAIAAGGIVYAGGLFLTGDLPLGKCFPRFFMRSRKKT